jgi:hypothetical protein
MLKYHYRDISGYPTDKIMAIPLVDCHFLFNLAFEFVKKEQL